MTVVLEDGLLRRSAAQKLRSSGANLRAWNLVNLRSKDEITFREPVDFMGPDGDGHASPPQEDVGMVPLLFGNGADCFYEFQRAYEVREVVALLDVVFFNDLPSTHLTGQICQFFVLQRRNSALAGNTRFLRKLSHALFAEPSEL